MSATALSTPVLQVRGLTTRFHTERGVVRAVSDVSFDVYAGQTMALVGESGSGKSVTAMSLLNLVRSPGRIEAGQVLFQGKDIVAMSGSELRQVRGNGISMVFQDPMSSLNPIMKIGEQLREAIHNRDKFSGEDAKKRAVELMKLVGIPDPEARLVDYPHKFSGGMRQRVMIAMALANEPDVIIADEPTTALDVTVQAQILDVLADINTQLGTAVILITHNLGVVARSCHRVAVMYAGRVVEQAETRELFANPKHPYTKALLAATPRMLASRDVPLVPIDGRPPNLLDPITGCSFAPRCQFAMDKCFESAPRTTVDGDRSFDCFMTADGGNLPALVAPAVASVASHSATTAGSSTEGSDVQPLLEVRNLSVHFPLKSASLNPFAAKRVLHAVDGVSFTVGKGETVGLVGESGCGKSSLGKTLVGINAVTGGEITFEGQDISVLQGKARQWVRRRLQMVFQDPMSSLNPRMKVGEIIGEPLQVHGLVSSGAERRAKVAELLELVGLDAEIASRYPHEFSGGQRQRIVIARALAVEPSLIVCDEAVAALDVSLQAQVVNLLKELQRKLGVSMLFIGHDLASVRHISERIMVMYLGQIIEEGPAETLTLDPLHPYTASLLSAVPEPDPIKENQRPRIVLTGDVPSPTNPPPGCRFSSRCPIGPEARDDRGICLSQQPVLEDAGQGRRVACHFPGELKVSLGVPTIPARLEPLGSTS